MLTISSDYTCREINNEIILINKFSSNEVYKFDGVAKLIITSILKLKTTSEIIDNITTTYEINRDIASNDVHKFIVDLIKLELLEEKND